MTRNPPNLCEQLPQIRRWSTLVLTTAALTLLTGWAAGAWNLPQMVRYVTGTFEVDDGSWDRTEREPPTWRGSRGTRVCLGCRTRRTVHKEFGEMQVLSEERGDCATWVFEQLPTHLHAWVDEACWHTVTDTDDGEVDEVIHCLATADQDISDALWLRYLRAHMGDDLEFLVLTATIGGPERGALHARVREWGAANG